MVILHQPLPGQIKHSQNKRINHFIKSDATILLHTDVKVKLNNLSVTFVNVSFCQAYKHQSTHPKGAKKMQIIVKIAKDDLKQLEDVPKSQNPSVLNENHLD